MLEISEQEKPRVLRDLLNQRYQAEHLMRQRSADFSKWVLGLGIALLWIILSQTQLSLVQKVFASAFVLGFTGTTVFFLAEICKGFINNRKIIVKLETLLGLYSPGLYGNGESILPKEYQESTRSKIPSHFKTLYALLVILGVFLIAIIIANPGRGTNQRTSLNQDTVSISTQGGE